MDYEDLILKRQELDYEDPALDYDRVDTRFFCLIDFAYRDCTQRNARNSVISLIAIGGNTMEITIKWTIDSKSDEEAKKKVKALLNTVYGYLSAAPLPDWDPEALRAELHKTKERYLQAEMDLQNRDDEIQDLKLENDRLKQREEIMLRFIGDLYDQAINDRVITRTEYINRFYGLRERLEAL